MPNYKEIARLKSTGQSNRSIAESLGISRNTVNQVVTRIEESGLDFEDLSRLTEAEINVVFPVNSGRKPDGEYFMPDFEELKKELAKPGVTLQLLWEEYSDRCRLSGRRPYQKTQFKKHFNDHLKKTGCIFRGGGAACPAWREPRVRTRRSHPFGTNVIQMLLSHRPLASTCHVLHQWP